MKNKLFFILCSLFFIVCSAIADETPVPDLRRVNVFSTSSDWEAVTGLRLSLYNVRFTNRDKLVKSGMELYYLDGFPCYGQPSRVQIWLNNYRESEHPIMLTCLYPPEYIYLAWRYAEYDAVQSRTTGMIKCPVSGESEFTVDMTKCTMEKDWTEYK